MRKLFILFAAVAFAFAFTTPAAAEVNFSGYVGFQTYMVNVDSDEPGYKDSDDLDWTLDRVCSRLTINFKEGPVSAVYEIRPLTASYVRHWFASWNFGAGTFGIGQFWTPEFSCISSSVYGCGALDVLDPACSVRIPFAQLQFGNLKIAAGEPATGVATGLPVAYTDTETSLPKLMASYNLNVAMVGLKFFGGYNTVDARDPLTDQTQGVDSYVYGLTAAAGFGPLTVKGQVWGGQNVTEYGSGAPGFAASWDGTKIVDADYMAYGFDVAYKVSDMLTVTAGYMTGESELDAPGTWEDEASTYHVNATIALAKGVTITPEYMVRDLEDVIENGVKSEELKTTVMGVYWKIAF